MSGVNIEFKNLIAMKSAFTDMNSTSSLLKIKSMSSYFLHAAFLVLMV